MEDNDTWRIKTNKELDELIKHRNIINYVKDQRLSWFGHINRRNEISIVKKLYKWKPFTRSKSRWEDDVRNGLKKIKLKKMDRTSPRSPQMESCCRESQDFTRVVAQKKKRRWRMERWLPYVESNCD
jgi:ABC-type proline/glycine betaine transport system ATPase subunit